MQCRLRAVALLITPLLIAACEPDECSANFVLGGAIDYSYAWRYPTTECNVRSTPDITSAGFKLETDGNFLEISSTTALTVGSHNVDVTYRAADGTIWTTDPFEYLSFCVMTISTSEVVDWVQEDHRRLSGLVDCTGEALLADNGSQPLTITGMVFNIYTADNGYY